MNIRKNEYDELESMLERVTGGTVDDDDEDDDVDNIVMPDTPPSVSTMACIEEDEDDEVHAAVTNKRKVFLRNFICQTPAQKRDGRARRLTEFLIFL